MFGTPSGTCFLCCWARFSLCCSVLELTIDRSRACRIQTTRRPVLPSNAVGEWHCSPRPLHSAGERVVHSAQPGAPLLACNIAVGALLAARASRTDVCVTVPLGVNVAMGNAYRTNS